MSFFKRREFLAGISGLAVPFATSAPAQSASGMRFGLVTYLWGQHMDLPTLLDTCERSGLLGVELRTEHAHGVEPSLSKAQRGEVRRRFEDSPVRLVGYGSNAEFHSSDPAEVRRNIELTQQYIQLMYDCGGDGVKVKPNAFVEGVPREKTIEQIGVSLNEIARYGADFGQRIRVEVHGNGTSELPVMKAIFDVADHANVGVCWNSNPEDLEGEGLEHNFNLVKDRLADTVHVRELDLGDYPYAELMKLFSGVGYDGWILLEARTDPPDKVQAMTEQRRVFERLASSA